MKKTTNDLDYKKLIAYWKGIPVGLTEQEKKDMEEISNKTTTYREVFNLLDYFLTTADKKYANVALQTETTARILTKRLKVSDKEWNQEQEDIENSVKEQAQKDAQEVIKIMKEIKTEGLSEEDAKRKLQEYIKKTSESKGAK